RRQQPGAQPDRLHAAEAREAPRLEHPDEQSLNRRRQVLDLMDEQSALAGLLQNAGSLRPTQLLATEQPLFRIRLAQTARDESQERRPGSRAALVQIARKSFAARSGLADQQHRGLVGRDLLQLGAQLLHHLAL